ncbi:hypothetical protein H3Z85_12365 [Chryseobacterium indologenes]|nr:hypothetical protein H3Z85_12365 [Chryseobacterium indologenes]
MNTIEIKGSKTKLSLLLLGSLIFLFLGLFLAFKPNRFISTIFKSETFISLAGILAILFAVLCLSILIKNFFNRSFNLVIDKKGLMIIPVLQV